MKLSKSTYFSIFFLFCFLASFSVNTFRSFNAKHTTCHLKQNKTISLSSKEDKSLSDTDFLLEENETSSENDFQAQVFTLPFFITYFQFEAFQTKQVPAQPLAEKLTNPIYIAVCNFRI